MIPYLLAAVGGYLLGDSMKESQTFAKGGGIKSFMYRVRFKNRAEESGIIAKNLKDLKEQIIAKFGSTDDVTKVEKFDLKYRRFFVVESTRHNQRSKKFADGGETEDDDMGVQFIDYKDKMIMFEPHFKKYYSNDVEFDSLEKAKKYIDSGSKSPSWERSAYRSEIMADGGETEGTFRNGVFEDRTPPKFTDYLTEVKHYAKAASKQYKNKTYVFHDIWNKGITENYSYGTDKELDYMKEKGMDFKVIATYENGEEKK